MSCCLDCPCLYTQGGAPDGWKPRAVCCTDEYKQRAEDTIYSVADTASVPPIP